MTSWETFTTNLTDKTGREYKYAFFKKGEMANKHKKVIYLSQ